MTPETVGSGMNAVVLTALIVIYVLVIGYLGWRGWRRPKRASCCTSRGWAGRFTTSSAGICVLTRSEMTEGLQSISPMNSPA